MEDTIRALIERYDNQVTMALPPRHSHLRAGGVMESGNLILIRQHTPT